MKTKPFPPKGIEVFTGKIPVLVDASFVARNAVTGAEVKLPAETMEYLKARYGGTDESDQKSAKPSSDEAPSGAEVPPPSDDDEPLPDNFPFADILREQGITTYEQVRALGGPEAIKGIGEAKWALIAREL